MILSLSLRGPPPAGVGVMAESRQWQSRHHHHLHHRTRFHQPPLRRWKIGVFVMHIHSHLSVSYSCSTYSGSSNGGGDGGEPCKGWSRPPLSQQLTKNRPLHLTLALAQQTGSKLGQELPD